MSRKESLIRGAAALAVAGLIIKVSNLLVRVPLTRVITAEGIGIYMMALPAFSALYHLAAGGVPVAVQNLVAEYTARGRGRVAEQVTTMALTYATVAGGVATLSLLAGARLLAETLGEPRAYWSLIAVAPAVLLFALDSIYRNYLQGRKLMTPSATASVMEQGTKVVVTLIVAYLMIPRGKDFAAGGAALGITAGAVVSVLYMAYIYRQIRADDGPDTGRLEARSVLVRRMFRLAWPVTVGSVVIPLISLLDVGIVQRGFLKAGYPQAAATSMYGAYQGIAVQVIWFPVVLTSALADALFPAIAAARARNDLDAVRERVHLGLRATGLICVPVVLGMAVLARPIASLFGEPLAVTPLLYMSPVAYFGPLFWLMMTELQALGNTAEPMRNFGLAMLLKVGLDYLLAPIPGVDIRGVALNSVLIFVFACWLNARALERELEEPLAWGALLQGPLVAALAMGAGLLGLGKAGLLPGAAWASLAVALVVAPVIYVGTLFVTRAVTWEELKEMTGPVGSRLERWLHSFWPWQ